MKGQLQIDEYESGKLTEMPAGGPRFRPLSYWRELLARTGGTIAGADGERVPVSLEPWSEASEDTMLAIYVKWIDPARVGTIDPNARPHS